MCFTYCSEESHAPTFKTCDLHFRECFAVQGSRGRSRSPRFIATSYSQPLLREKVGTAGGVLGLVAQQDAGPCGILALLNCYIAHNIFSK